MSVNTVSPPKYRRPDWGSSWDNPEIPAKWYTVSWFTRWLCNHGWHNDPIFDGYGWDGGHHCGICGTNWV